MSQSSQGLKSQAKKGIVALTTFHRTSHHQPSSSQGSKVRWIFLSDPKFPGSFLRGKKTNSSALSGMKVKILANSQGERTYVFLSSQGSKVAILLAKFARIISPSQGKEILLHYLEKHLISGMKSKCYRVERNLMTSQLQAIADELAKANPDRMPFTIEKRGKEFWAVPNKIRYFRDNGDCLGSDFDVAERVLRAMY